jgi:hypothetical protein
MKLEHVRSRGMCSFDWLPIHGIINFNTKIDATRDLTYSGILCGIAIGRGSQLGVLAAYDSSSRFPVRGKRNHVFRKHDCLNKLNL